MKKTTLVCAIAFTCTSFANYPEQSQAQFIELTSSISQSGQNSNLPPAAEDSTEGRRAGTGSRGEECSISSSGKQIKLTLSTTPSDIDRTSDSPTIRINVKYEPDQVENDISGKLFLEDKKTNKKLPPISIDLPRTSGNFSIPLPEGFDPDKKYYWYLEIDDCEVELSEQDIRQ